MIVKLLEVVCISAILLFVIYCFQLKTFDHTCFVLFVSILALQNIKHRNV